MAEHFPYADLHCWTDPPGEDDYPRRVLIEGLIGAGKTSFAEALAEVTGYRVFKEPVQENPFLDVYYENMERYAFSMQVYLLTMRLSMERAATYMVQAGLEEGVIGDRSLGGDTVFLKVNALLGNIPIPEYQLYFRLFEQMKIECPYPDAIVYLDVPLDIIKERIRNRGRACEEGILDPNNPYLEMIEKEYKAFCAAMSRHTYVAALDWSEFGDVSQVWEQIVTGWRSSDHSRFQKILLKW